MSASKERLIYLLEKYTGRTCTWQEYQELFGELEKDENKELLLSYMDEKFRTGESGPGRDPAKTSHIYQNIRKKIEHRQNVLPLRRLIAAAIVLLFSTISVFLWLNPAGRHRGKQGRNMALLSSPGNKVILKLGNGREISLTDAASGEVVRQKGSRVFKNKEGLLEYRAEDIPSEKDSLQEAISYNTITTPVGIHYQLILPDGTGVWLNSKTTMTFPSRFSGDKREVRLSGEAYFEVAKVYKAGGKTRLPFIVQSADQEVEVLGTNFNINAYPDETATKTTLLEGRVRVTSTTTRESRLLSPGQQALLKDDHLLTTKEADTEEATGWKNNLFIFNNSNLDEVTRQIRRWYNVQFIYKGTRPAIGLTGVIPRDKNIREVLNMLQSTGDIQFSISGNAVTVEKK